MHLPEPCDVGGLPVHPVGRAALLRWVEWRLAEGQRATIMYANPHAVNLARQDESFREALRRATLVFCDGFGVWLASRLLGRPLPERLTMPDWIEPLLALCERERYRLFLLGSAPGVAARAAERVVARYPLLEVASHHGYFNLESAENERLLADIRSFAPDLILVGMGMPRQERWIIDNLSRHEASLVIAAGALFEHLAGRVTRGPRWLTNRGGEWLVRLLTHPRKFWRRYLLGNPRFLWLIFQQWYHERRHRQ